ncbi:MAG: P-loop NTPase fold protein [Candidatus Bathyarchaeia archaeon]
MSKKRKNLLLGDDSIEASDADWFHFTEPAINLSKQLYTISNSSGVCCGIVGPWGSGKSSFMRLMREFIRSKSGRKNISVVWFTAWDPGGIEDLGDAMLYRFFEDVAGSEASMAKAFQELKEALGIRRSLRERARRTLSDVSTVLPAEGRIATRVASTILGELDTPKKVQNSFDDLMGWLENKRMTVFLFVDDIDRATGEQIRDLLSELKLYISHRRIVAVLGYDEGYVLSALSPVLPVGINPKTYLEKIVTIKRSVPRPGLREMQPFASHLIASLVKTIHADSLGDLATRLSGFNPRRLKSVVLAFAQYAAPRTNKSTSFRQLATWLIVTAASDMSFLKNNSIANAFELGRENDITDAIKRYIEENPDKKTEGEQLITVVNRIAPEFAAGSLGELGLRPEVTPRIPARREREEQPMFNWKSSLLPILASAASHGFKIPQELGGKVDVAVGPSERIESFTEDDSFRRLTQGEMLRRRIDEIPMLSWEGSRLIVILTSYGLEPIDRVASPELVLRRMATAIRALFNDAPLLTSDRRTTVLVVDDLGLFAKAELEGYVGMARQISKGLKNEFVFQYVPAEKVGDLLSFPLSVSSHASTSSD